LLKTLYPRFQNRNLTIIGLNVEESHLHGPSPEAYANSARKMQNFVRKYDIPWMQATEESIYSFVTDRLHVDSFPTTILIDPNGKIVGRNWPVEELAEKLDKVLPAPKR